MSRRDCQEAARAKTSARATLLAMQAAWGCEGASSRLNQFYSEMDAIISADPFAVPKDPDQPGAAEIAAFEAIAARARQGSPS